jgi:hypothetical protein
MTKWAKDKLVYLRWAYGEFYDYAVEVDQNDDRRLFITFYNQLEAAITAVAEIDNAYVRAALGSKIEETQKAMTDIGKRFYDKFKANVV